MTLQVEDFCGDNIASVCDRGVGNGVHLGQHSTYPQGRRQVPWNMTCVGALEGGIHQVPCHFAWVQRAERDRDDHIGLKSPPEDCGNTAGGIICDIFGYLQDLWCAELGARSDNTGRVRGGPLGI